MELLVSSQKMAAGASDYATQMQDQAAQLDQCKVCVYLSACLSVCLSVTITPLFRPTSERPKPRRGSGGWSLRSWDGSWSRLGGGQGRPRELPGNYSPAWNKKTGRFK